MRAALAGACPVLVAGTGEAPAGLAANYHHNARVSLPNYLAMTSGSTHGLNRNCMPRQCPIRGPSIFTQLARHGMKWRAFQESMPGHTAVFLTFDEGSNRNGHIPTVVVSPYTPAGKVSHRRFGHYSLLRTTERVLGIRRCLGKACSARGLSKAFRL